MNPVTDHLQKLENKIRQLREDYLSIKKENEILIRQSVAEKTKIEEQNILIEHLNKQVQALKIAKSVESTQDTGKAKAKIQDLVREIDRCIELLNK